MLKWSFNPFWDLSKNYFLLLFLVLIHLSIPFGIYQFLIEELKQNGKMLSIPFGIYQESHEATEAISKLFSFQSLLGFINMMRSKCKINMHNTFNPFWDLSKFWVSRHKDGWFRLSIPFGIYHPCIKRSITINISFNPFWDLSVFKVFGQLVRKQKTFNPFWDLSECGIRQLCF